MRPSLKNVNFGDPPDRQALKALKVHPGLPSGSYNQLHDAVHVFSTEEDDKRLYSLDTGFFASELAFDSSSSLLRTNGGTIALTDNKGRSNVHVAFEGLGLFSGCDWITWKEERLLFIPLEYRPCSFGGRPVVSVEGMNVAIGRKVDKIIIVRFQL